MPSRTDTDPTDRVQERSDWPYTTLLLFGFFGTDTPAGKRFARRNNGFMLLFLFFMLMSGARDGFHALFPDLIWLLGLPASVIGTGWAYTRYLRSLDEMRRMLQLKAFAFGYGSAMTLVATTLAVTWMTPTPWVRWEFLGLPVLAEVFRGLALIHLARQYR